MTHAPGFKFHSDKPRRKRPFISAEDSLQITVVEHMRLAAMPGCWCLHIPNEGKRTPAGGLKMKRMGMLPGAADLFIHRPNEAPLFMELKAKGGTISAEQSAFGGLCAATGAAWCCAFGIDEALKILREAGALKPATGGKRRAQSADDARRTAA